MSCNKEKKYKDIFLIILLITIFIHIIFLIISFSYHYGFKEIPKKQEAQIILQKPKPKPKPKPRIPKMPTPKFSGLAGGTPKPQPQIQPQPKQQPTKKEEPKKQEKEIKKRPKPKPKPKLKEKTTLKKLQPKQVEKPILRQASDSAKATSDTQDERKKKEPTKLIEEPPKKKLSLSDISKGFLNYAQNQGSNLVQYTNSKKGMPTDEQMKHERYVSKILACIRTTLDIRKNSFEFIRSVSIRDTLTVDINLILEKDGKLANLYIIKTSGFPEFDRFMVKTLTESSSSFPPVPDYLKTSQYFLPIRFFLPVAMFRPSTSANHYLR